MKKNKDNSSSVILKELYPLLTGKQDDVVDKFLIRASQLYSLKKYYKDTHKTLDNVTEEFLAQVDKDLTQTIEDKEVWNKIVDEINLRVEYSKKYLVSNMKDLENLPEKKDFPAFYEDHLTSDQKDLVKLCDVLYLTSKYLENYIEENNSFVVDGHFVFNMTNSPEIEFVLKKIYPNYTAPVFEDKTSKEEELETYDETSPKDNILFSNEKDDLIDKFLINSTKYVSLKIFYKNNPDQRPTDSEQRFFTAYEINMVSILMDKENQQSFFEELNARMNTFASIYDSLNQSEIKKTAKIINNHPEDFRKYLNPFQRDFVNGCDILKSTITALENLNHLRDVESANKFIDNYSDLKANHFFLSLFDNDKFFGTLDNEDYIMNEDKEETEENAQESTEAENAESDNNKNDIDDNNDVDDFENEENNEGGNNKEQLVDENQNPKSLLKNNSKKSQDTIDKLFMRATKYMMLKRYFEKHQDKQPTKQEQDFMNGFLEQFTMLASDKEIWNHIETKMLQRAKSFNNAYDFNAADIEKIAKKVNAIKDDWKKYFSNDDKLFVIGCDMLKSTADFIKEVANNNLENKISDDFIVALTSPLAVNAFWSNINENVEINTFEEKTQTKMI